MSLPRLILGALIVAVTWVATTLVAVGGSLVHARWFSGAQEQAGGALQGFLTSPAGMVATLVSFTGIWLGLWIAMRFVHGEPLGALLGNSRRLSWPGFAKGFAAVVLTSLATEVALYLLHPGMERSAVAWSSWLLLVVPVTALTLLQTSAEEALFRGYLPRGLAARFGRPVIWGVVPILLFTAMHWSAAPSLAINLSALVSIGAFALVLMLTVYATGNLGAAFGAHLANNLFGFLLISHQENYNAFALFTARPLEDSGWTGGDALAISAIGVVACALTALLLLHPRSPLRVAADTGRLRDAAPA